MLVNQLAKLAAQLNLGDITHELGNLSQLKYDPRRSLVENLDSNLTAAGDRAGRRKNDVEEANALRAAYAEMVRRRAAGPFFSHQKRSDFASGPMRKKNYGDLSQLQPGELLTFLRQRHDATRAGLHTDVRIGDKARGLFSWAVPKDIPEPGGRSLAIQQNTHRFKYKDFEGAIPKNQYGGGTVSKIEEGQVRITKAGPEGIHFTRVTGQPAQFLLAPTFGSDSRKRKWMLVNTTPLVSRDGQETGKVDAENLNKTRKMAMEYPADFISRLAGLAASEKQAGPVQDTLRRLLQSGFVRGTAQTVGGGLGGYAGSKGEQLLFDPEHTLSPEGRAAQDIGNTMLGALAGNRLSRNAIFKGPGRGPAVNPVTGSVIKNVVQSGLKREAGPIRSVLMPMGLASAAYKLPSLTDKTNRFVNVLGSEKTQQAVNSAADMVADAKDYFERARPLADKVIGWAADPKFNEHAWESGTEIGKRVAGPLGVLAGGGITGGLLGRLAAGGVGSLVAADDERLPYEARRRRERIRGLLSTAGMLGGSAGGSYLAYRSAPAILKGMGLTSGT